MDASPDSPPHNQHDAGITTRRHENVLNFRIPVFFRPPLSTWFHLVDTLGGEGGRFLIILVDRKFSESDWQVTSDLLGSSLDGAVLAGHVLAVPVVGGAAGQAEVGVALPHRQVARALLGVALGFAPTTRETVLTCGGGYGGECCASGCVCVCVNAQTYTQSCTDKTSRRSSEQ